MALKDECASIVGSEYVSDDPDTVEKYSKDCSFVPQRRPSYVVYAKNAEEVQGVVRYANEHRVPVIPRSSRISFYGAGIPSQGGIILDLSMMNRILELSERDKKAKIEPGVTWFQLQDELEKQGMMVCNPLLPHSAKSVLTSSLEREPIVIPRWEYSETFLTGEVVLPDGDMLWLGTAADKSLKGQHFPEGVFPGHRIFLGAQGTLGIVTWAYLKAEFLPKMDKLFFIPFDRIEDIVEPVYRIQRRMLGNECFVLNDFNLAAIVTEKWPEEFEALRQSLPPLTLILCLSGLDRLPEEKIEYEEEALTEVASELDFEVLHTVAKIPRLGERILKLIRKPWQGEVYWKLRYKGSCHDIFFHTTLDRVPEFVRAMVGVAAKYRYPSADIGFYLQPVERGQACFCQYAFHCNPSDKKDVERIRSLYLEASELAISMGGLFTTPYGPWANMVYGRASSYNAMLKLVKTVFDPNNIMNPGKLCF